MEPAAARVSAMRELASSVRARRWAQEEAGEAGEAVEMEEEEVDRVLVAPPEGVPPDPGGAAYEWLV